MPLSNGNFFAADIRSVAFYVIKLSINYACIKHSVNIKKAGTAKYFGTTIRTNANRTAYFNIIAAECTVYLSVARNPKAFACDISANMTTTADGKIMCINI